MIKFRIVPFALAVSTALLAFFFVFGIYTHYAEVQKQKRAAEVRAEERQAQKRLRATADRLNRLEKVRDSLRVMVRAQESEEVLWLARALYSETRRPYEMRYVAWVIRNRVEANFNGEKTYKDVILDHKEFSAFNKGYPLRDLYVSLKPSHARERPTWHDAMAMAVEVMDKPDEYRPFPRDTFYYYSQVSMPGYGHPEWRYQFDRVSIADSRIEPRRFRFFRDSTPANATVTNSTTATAR